MSGFMSPLRWACRIMCWSTSRFPGWRRIAEPAALAQGRRPGKPGAVDLDLTDRDGFLYVLSSSSGAITGFSVNGSSGALTGIGGVSGLATGYAGLIAT